MRPLLLLLFCSLPLTSHAAVVVSEVAWMGSAASANHEWIELYNDGSAVVVDGWTLTDGMNLLIPLSGTIPAQSYVVLERTSDISAAGTAFLIYTGSLVNTGATLQLKRSDGGLEDQVAGGENWQSIGGDNLTKETAQYTNRGWVTGIPTPGQQNSGAVAGTPKDTPPSEPKNGSEPSSTTAPKKLTVGRGEAVRLVLPDVSLKLSVIAQKLGYVNQSISFTVNPSGVGDSLIDSLTYEWNFGDGTTGLAKEATHTYQYPGTYVVTVYGGYKRQEQVARHEITILPVSLSLTVSQRGDLQINNESPYEIDISGYRVSGGKDFLFPARSVLLPNQTVTIAKERIGSAYQAVVRDSAGAIVLTKERSTVLDTPTVPTVPEKQIVTVAAPLREQGVLRDAWHPPLLPPSAEVLGAVLQQYLSVEMAEAATATPTGTAAKQPVIPQSAWPYLGLIIVILIGLIGTARKVTSNQTQ